MNLSTQWVSDGKLRELTTVRQEGEDAAAVAARHRADLAAMQAEFPPRDVAAPAAAPTMFGQPLQPEAPPQ